MSVFTLKARDTRPVLRAMLKNPDGSAFSLVDTTAWTLHVKLAGGAVFTRPMTKVGPDADGVLQYIWQTSDWGAAPLLPIVTSIKELPMEYEVLAGTERFTFPNGTNDTLKIVGDLG